MRILILADAAGLIAFAVLGLRFHGAPVTAEGVLRTAAPLWAAWFLVAASVGTYCRPGWLTLLANWAIAIPLGLVARQILLKSRSYPDPKKIGRVPDTPRCAPFLQF